MPTPPALSDDQRQAALAKAAEARRVRAALKEKLKAGEVSLAELFERAQDDPIVAGTKILTIVESMPRTGKVKARRTLAAAGVSESRRVRGVGPAQRHRLLAAFPPES